MTPTDFRRNKMIATYVTEGEKEAINKLIREFNFPSISIFIRQAVFDAVTNLRKQQQTELG